MEFISREKEIKIKIFINNNNFNSEDPSLISPIEQITASSEVQGLRKFNFTQNWLNMFYKTVPGGDVFFVFFIS